MKAKALLILTYILQFDKSNGNCFSARRMHKKEKFIQGPIQFNVGMQFLSGYQ
ncbi:hypothetical protein [Pedobacter frigiditerrae]|uniref:hypothetical protein n=1 Tax=Pedobacter frigiditerrae TaxID=2530452 RepID=UPI0029304679|nr:hypothetical protein [Pedobacter frigiditerrae]